MNWKLIFRTSGIFGVMAIPIQLIGFYFDVMSFYKALTVWEVIVFASFCVVVTGLAFNFIYQQTTKFRIFQSLITIVLSYLLSLGFAILGLIIYLKFFA